jgi:hypothetical protein
MAAMVNESFPGPARWEKFAGCPVKAAQIAGTRLRRKSSSF